MALKLWKCRTKVTNVTAFKGLSATAGAYLGHSDHKSHLHDLQTQKSALRHRLKPRLTNPETLPQVCWKYLQFTDDKCLFWSVVKDRVCEHMFPSQIRFRLPKSTAGCVGEVSFESCSASLIWCKSILLMLEGLSSAPTGTWKQKNAQKKTI